MSYCLNPACQKPQNPDTNKLCQNCKKKLLLGDRYRAIQPIGQGSFGRTFLAVDEYKPSKPRCVIKQFLPQSQGTDNPQEAAALFQQEVVRLEELGKHPQLPELLAYFTQDNRQYLVQEFIDGQNLAQELAQEGAFSEHQIRQLLHDLLPLLQFFHHKGVIHRDIKPENIIRRTPPDQGGETASLSLPYQGGGQLVLVDFGVAIAPATAVQKTGTAVGSAEYVAPEQASGKAVFASDIYSLGVVCIHLLTEIPPFDLFDVSEDKWVWRHYLSGSMSNELSQIIDKMLERSTKHRYQSAYEVLADLNHKPSGASVKSVAVKNPGSHASDLTHPQVISPVPISVSFGTERFLLGTFVVTTLFSGSLSPTSAVLALGSLISLILIILSYRFQSFPEVAKKYELISKIRNGRKEILIMEKYISSLQYKSAKLPDKVNKITNQQLNITEKEKQEIDEVERELQSIVAEIDSCQSRLNAAESEEIVQEMHAVNDQSIADQLIQYSIRSANIAGIGPEITKRLLDAGIKTAADIEYEKVINVNGIGESRASNLISWRKQVEYTIIEEMPNPLSAYQAAAIREKYKNQCQSLSLRKTAALQAATEKKDAIRRNYQQQQDILAKNLQDAQVTTEAAYRELQEKINKQSHKLDESHKVLASLEQALDAYSQVNFSAYMKRILFFS